MSFENSAEKRAVAILGRAQARSQRRSALFESLSASLETSSQVLVAEGDSWFDYPGTDVLEELEDGFGYEVRSVAHRGDTIESMAYGKKQLDKLTRMLLKVQSSGQIPKAILISGGGNDIAGHELEVLLNHQRSGLGPLNEPILTGLIDIRLKKAHLHLMHTVTQLCHKIFESDVPISILVHGYDYPVPDGRGYWGGWGPLPGPWLEPAFKAKGYRDLEANTQSMQDVIERFNTMLSNIPLEAGLGHVKYVSMIGTLSNELANEVYKDWGSNELHPEDQGFEAVAKRLHEALNS